MKRLLIIITLTTVLGACHAFGFTPPTREPVPVHPIEGCLPLPTPEPGIGCNI